VGVGLLNMQLGVFISDVTFGDERWLADLEQYDIIIK
jgi:hypothetical protein